METSIDTLVGSTAPSTDQDLDCGPIIIGSGGAHRRQNSTDLTGSFSTLLSATDPASDPDDSPKMMVHSSDPAVRDAISVIESAGLPYPCCQLLIVFILEALDPRVAALYVIAKGEEEKLHLLAQDWRYIVESVSLHGSPPPAIDTTIQAAITRRDGNRCCITGKPGTFKDPLIVVPILPVPHRWANDEVCPAIDNPRLYEVLSAFFSEPYRDFWLKYIRRPLATDPFDNHWLVSRSAAEAAAKGLVRLNRLKPSMVEYEAVGVFLGPGEPPEIEGPIALLGDHSRTGLRIVDPRFVGTHARLCPSLRWLAIAEHIAHNEQPRHFAPGLRLWTAAQRPFFFERIAKRVFFAVWHIVPDRIRVLTYEVLRSVGRRMYEPEEYTAVQRLPFGLYLKSLGDPSTYLNEYNALRMVRGQTTIPVPEPLDVVFVSHSDDKKFYPRDAYLLFTSCPGVPIADACRMLSDKDLAGIASQLRGYVTQLRAIPKTVAPGFSFCNTLGGPCQDSRIRDGMPVGPFIDEMSFSQLLRHPDEPSRRGHESLFTHGDLSFQNILVDQFLLPDGTRGWRISGIVDWEYAGYYPEYWEYTKALYEGFRLTERMQDVFHEVFRGIKDYSKEYEIEEMSWEEGDYI